MLLDLISFTASSLSTDDMVGRFEKLDQREAINRNSSFSTASVARMRSSRNWYDAM
jgi:hypothetical protein